MGDFSNGRFDLVVSLQYEVEHVEITFLGELFNKISQILYHATHGQHSIRSVMIASNFLADNTDILVHLDGPGVWTNASGAYLWENDTSIDVKRVDMCFVTIMVHELSHYFYGLRDEYTGRSYCQGNIRTHGSLMESYDWFLGAHWRPIIAPEPTFYLNFGNFIEVYRESKAEFQLGDPSEYCDDYYIIHNTVPENHQNIFNNYQSCWTTMVNGNFGDYGNYGLHLPGNISRSTGPGAKKRDHVPLIDPESVAIKKLIPEQRIMLILDINNISDIELDQLKIGANFWVDYVNGKEVFGIITSNIFVNVIMPLSKVPSNDADATEWRKKRHTIVDNISENEKADDKTSKPLKTKGGIPAGVVGMAPMEGGRSILPFVSNIGDSLRKGLSDIIAGGLAASQILILFTRFGKKETYSENIQEVIMDILAAGVRVYIIGFGVGQNAALLNHITSVTGGRYFEIDHGLKSMRYLSAFTDALAQIAGDVRAHSGIVSFEAIDGAVVEETFEPSTYSIPFDWADGENEILASENSSFQFPVNITDESTSCTLGAMWQNSPKERFEIKVYNPEGKLIRRSETVRFVEGEYPYSYYVINDPMPGKWKVKINGSAIRKTKFRTIGFEVNNEIRIELSTINSHIKAGEVIKFKARLIYKYPLEGVKINAIIRFPSGDWKSIEFHENSGKDEDKEEAGIYTLEIPSKKQEIGQYLIYFRVHKKKSVQIIELDELHKKSPTIKKGDEIVKIKVPEIYREKLQFVVLSPDSKTKGDFIFPNKYELLKRVEKKHGKK